MLKQKQLKLFISFVAFISCIFITTGNVKAAELTVIIRANDGEPYIYQDGEDIEVECDGVSDAVEGIRESSFGISREDGSAILNLDNGEWKCHFSEDSDNVDKAATITVTMTGSNKKVYLDTGLDNVKDEYGYGEGTLKVTVVDEDGKTISKHPDDNIVVNCVGVEPKRVEGNPNKIMVEDNEGYVFYKKLDYGKYSCFFDNNSDVENNSKYTVKLTEDDPDKTLIMHAYSNGNSNNENDDYDVRSEVIIKNVDEKSNLLSGAKLCITKEENGACMPNTEWTSSNSEAKSWYNLAAGKYYIKVKSAPTGYTIPKSYSFTVAGTGDKQTINVINVKIEEEVNNGSLIVKYLDENNKYLKGTVLRLLDSNGKEIKKWTTDTGSKIFSDLTPGKYTIEEVKAAEGYASISKIAVEIKKGETYEAKIEAAPLVKVPDTLSNFSKLIIIAGITGLLAGVGLLYFNAKRREEV